jgi:hypothetical protein
MLHAHMVRMPQSNLDAQAGKVAQLNLARMQFPLQLAQVLES